MKLFGLHVTKEDKIWKLEADYAGMDGNIEATRTFIWKFFNTTELLAKAEELLKAEHN